MAEFVHETGGEGLSVMFLEKKREFKVRATGIFIGNTQCGNFRIFLPLKFYEKSILVILKPLKLPF